MRLGVLDVGSNTVHLLIVDAHAGAAPVPALSQKYELRLSEQLKDDGSLKKASVKSLIDATAAKSSFSGFNDDIMLFTKSFAC